MDGMYSTNSLHPPPSWTFFYLNIASFNQRCSFSIEGQTGQSDKKTLRWLHLKSIRKGKGYLHFTQQGVVTGVGREVLLKNCHGARESHMPTATEQGHSREA